MKPAYTANTNTYVYNFQTCGLHHTIKIKNYIMMKDILIKALAEALEMDPSVIKQEDLFRNYENYSSLTELSILAMLDTEFGIEMEMKEFNELKSVDDLINLVSSK